MNVDNSKLIRLAASKIKAHKTKSDGLIGDVGCAVEDVFGDLHVGVCASLGSNVFCAEQIALGAMVTQTQQHKFRKIVAVWLDDEKNIYVIPPCGTCRQVMREYDEENLNAKVILDKEKTVQLKELIPFHDWWKKQDGMNMNDIDKEKINVEMNNDNNKII